MPKVKYKYMNKTDRINVRFDRYTMICLKEAADRKGMTMSEYIRDVVCESIKGISVDPRDVEGYFD